jgi:hypothetical protein
MLTATVRAASGSATPEGNVVFALGSVELGIGTLVGYGGTATATLTLSNANLASGNNTIQAYYSGHGAFSGYTGFVTVNASGQ